MATAVGMNFKMTASIAKFQASMDKVEEKLKNIERSGKQTASGMKLLAGIEVGKLLVSGLTSVFGIMKSGVSTVTQFASEAAAAADAIGKLASSTGMAHEPLQVFQKLAEENGISGDKLGEAVKRMTKRLAEAKMGFGEALPALERLGLNVEELASMRPEQAFLKIGAAIGQLPQKGDQAAAAFKIFSDQGLAMVPMFANLEANVKDTADEMLSLGQILSGTQIKNIEAMNDAFADVKRTAFQIGTQVLANFAPAITKANEQLLEFIKNFEYQGLTGGQGLVQFASDALEKVVKALASAFDRFLNLFMSTVHSLLEALDSFLAGVSVALAPLIGAEASAGILNAAMQVDHFARSLEGFNSNVRGFVDESLQNLKGASNDAADNLRDLGAGTDLSTKQIEKMMTGGMGAAEAMDVLASGVRDTAGVVSINLRSLGAATERATRSLDISGPAGLVKNALSALVAAPTAAASGLSGLAQGFLDVLAPLGYTRDRIIELGNAANMAKDFRTDIFNKHMSAWDQKAVMIRDRLISNGMNAFDANYLMMQDRAREVAAVNKHLDGLMGDHLKKIGGLSQNTEQAGKAVADAGKVLGEKLSGAATTAAEWATGLAKDAGDWLGGLFGGGEGDAGPTIPEPETTLPELQRQSGTLDGILTAVQGFGANFVQATF